MFLLTYSVCFPVKIKSARESHFWRFLDFFHGWKSLFHVHFCPPFHGQSKVFTDTCLDFFHGWIFFSREGNSECLLIFTEEIFFSGVQKKDNNVHNRFFHRQFLRYYELSFHIVLKSFRDNF